MYFYGLEQAALERRIVTDVFVMELEPSGILSVNPATGSIEEVEVTAEFVDEMARCMKELCGDKQVPILFMFHEVYIEVPNEVQQHIKTHVLVNSIKKAEAIVTRSLASRFFANVYLRVVKPAKPAKLFTDEAKAREWLMEFI